MYSNASSSINGPNSLHSSSEIGPFTKLLLKITGTDEETLRLCPQRDWDNVRAIGEIMICTLLYQTALFTLIGYQLFARPGQIRPDILLAGIFLGLFILLIDAYVIMRSGWELSGIGELKRGGIDISGGRGARIKASYFLGVRISLSIGLAQLTAIFVGLLVFGADIASHLQDAYLKANAHLISSATALVDGQIERATEAVRSSTRQSETLAAQVAALRGNEVSNPEVQQAQQEVTDLIARKAKADEDLRAAEAFATNELGGIKGASGNSGQPGRGARYRAGVEQANSAKTHSQQVGKDLDVARARLDNARRQASIANDPTKPRATDQLPAFEKALRDETNRLTGLKDDLAKVTNGREAAIRSAVESAADHVPYAGGFLNRLVVLGSIAEDNGRIAAVILLMDLVSFGFELAAVLAKVTGYVPTTYAKLLARNSYMQAVKMAEEISAELNAGGQSSVPEPFPPGGTVPDSEQGANSAQPFDLPQNETNPPPQPPLKRGRGRPRKHPLNPLNGSEPPMVSQGQNGQKPGESDD
jgi:hypothetical protein